MTKPTLLVAGAAIAVAPLLVACSGTTSSSSTAPTSAAAPASSSSTASSSGASSAPAPTTPSATAPAPTPSSDRAGETAEVEKAAENFTKVAFTIGYPDKTFDVYLDRLAPLMTDAGFADAKKSYEDRPQLAKTFKGFYHQHQRTSVSLTSPAKVTFVSAD